MRRNLVLLGVAGVWVLAACGQANQPAAIPAERAQRSIENSRDFGDYVVHFNAILTSQLTPDIARQYGIVRSDNRAMLNVSIIEKAPGSPGVPVPGSVEASAVNLTGQRKNVTLREIREQTAVYYIAELPVANEETIVFTIDVTPVDEPNVFSVRYMKQFYAD